jgi:uncharacterized protein DUF1801
MFKTTTATSPDEYIEALEEPRRTQIRELDRLIGEVAPQLERHIQSGMLAYGRYHYRYASGREGDWFRIGLASNKRYISMYVTATDGKRYLAETYKDRLPKADIGRSCVRFKEPEDLDRSALESLIREGAAAPAS